MKLSELRQAFLKYFEKNNHKIVSSSSLVPHGDESILFTNAGMVQFKDTFLGSDLRDYSAASSQKCLRVGGKHNDLENVGFTSRHLTFFEMLGNFSFGQYFKKEAIKFAWEFLTKELKLPKEKLWITIHNSDDESLNLWVNNIGVDPNKVSKLGDADNFWSMGETGPCGPCSEIFYDYGPSFEGSPPGQGDGGDRYVEIWNLVFMEFNRDLSGELHPLPNKCVDTGSGLERLCAVLQGVGSNFEIDFFSDFKKSISNLFPNPNDQSLNVVVDHIRSVFFLMSETIYPSNEGRGYVVRRLIRRAIRHGYKMGITEPFLYKCMDVLKDLLQEDFYEDFKNVAEIMSALKDEEELFFRTLSVGMKIFEDSLKNQNIKILSGEVAFKLHDTFGFPIDLTQSMAEEHGISVDLKVFESLMQKQKAGSKKSSMFNAKDFVIKPGVTSEFVGYETLKTEGHAELLFSKEGKEVNEIVDHGFIIFNQTPFYAESGGQVGDTGILKSESCYGEIIDCKKSGDVHIHEIKIIDGMVRTSEKYELCVDGDRRERIIRNHSAAHLLHSALRKVLGDSVEQKGSLVNEEKLRFDFSFPKKLSEEQISDIEELVNEQIDNAIETQVRVMPYKKALETGAIAFFGDKYGDNVRVLNIGGNFSVEFCGGTHVKNTSDIGGLIISSESSVSSGVRRVEAITGTNLVKKSKKAISLLERVEKLLNVSDDQVLSKLESVLKENKKLKSGKKAEKSLNAEIISEESYSLGGKTGKLILQKDASIEMLRRAADKAVKNKNTAFSILISADEKKLSYIVISNIKNPNAKDLILMVNEAYGGRGGGREDFAQGGSPDISNLTDKFIELSSAIAALKS